MARSLDPVQIEELAEMIAKIVGWEGEFGFNTDLPDGTRRKPLDVSRLAGLGWYPSIDLRSGLAETLSTYRGTWITRRPRGAVLGRPVKRLRRTWGTLRPLLGERRWRLVVLVAASILTGIVEAGILVVIAQVAFALTRGDPQVVTTLGPISVQTTPGVMLIAGASLAGLRVALQVAVVYMPARIGADVQSGLRRDLFDTFVRADWPTQASDREGHLQELLGTHVLRAVQAVEAIATGMAAALTFLALIVSALSVNVLVGLVLLLVGAALFLSLRPLVMLQRRHARRTSEASFDVAASASEAVRVGEEIQVFGVEEPQAQRFSRSVDAFEGPFFKMSFFGRLAPSAYQSLAMLLLVGGLGILVALGSSRLAALGTVVLILVRSLSYGQQVQASYSTLNQLVPFVERIREATEAYRRARPPSGRHRLRRIDRLELRSVGYSYGQGLLALEGVRGEIRAGTAVGIVGPSGVGKSTLVQVLLRLREPTEGSYLVNDEEASVWLREDWRSLVATVPQEPKLIAGTVADNIRFFRPGLDDEAVERAARLAHVHDEITARPGGYEGRVGQRADALSGGQRQRLCIARALAADPQVLILDEPTSALDARSEELILETLHELKGRLTLVVVAHRLALLEVCDQVWEMKEGGMTSRPGVSRPAGNVMKVPRANRFGLDT